MEFFNNIWKLITTENEMLTKAIGLPLIVVESYVYMLLFTTVLEIKCNNKQKAYYILFSCIMGVLCSLVIPKPYSNIITAIGFPIIIIFVFKVGIIKAIFAEFLPIICVTIFELTIFKSLCLILNIDYSAAASIPLSHLCINSIIYLFIYVLAKLAKKFNLNIHIKDSINARDKRLIILNIVFALIFLLVQIYLIVYYVSNLPITIVFINILSSLVFFSINVYSLIETMNLEDTKLKLEQEKQSNKTLQMFHDNIRAFRHDFANIIAGIGGYVETNDMPGLKKYYYQLLDDCNQVNNLGSLNSDTINNPAVYVILANKYYKADEQGIKISLDCFIDFNKLNMEIYEFTRILGILMDNAIEAARECDEKIINIIIRNDPRQNRQLLIIENTYKDNSFDLEKIYEKGYSTKKNNSGLGLWEVDRIINKRKHLTRFTTTDNSMFRQQIEIYNH